MRLTAKHIMTLDQARERYAHYLMLSLHEDNIDESFLQTIGKTLKPYCPGRCPIQVYYQNSQASTPLPFGDKWCLTPTETLMQALRELVGEDNVRLVY